MILKFMYLKGLKLQVEIEPNTLTFAPRFKN